MRAFRFRAQAALDLRRREDDDARRVYAQAEQDLVAAAQLLQEAENRAVAAVAAQAHALGSPGDAGDLQWHRSWIVRLEQERRNGAARLEEHKERRAEASAACQRTRQRVQSLERLKDKTHDTHTRAEETETRKELDMIGTLRFVAARRAR